ncbi:MAG: LPXTG cell wall anchor domain-containing protein [Actinomycetes bacterium]
MYVDGQPVNLTLSWSQGNRVTGRIGEVDLSLTFPNWLVGNGGSTTFAPGSRMAMTLDGLRPGSTVTATIFSDPTSLGQFTVSSSGVVDATFSIPSNIALGSHRIRLEMVGNDGRAIAVWLGVEVQGTPLQLPATGTDASNLMVLAFMTSLIGVLGVVASRRRHMM